MKVLQESINQIEEVKSHYDISQIIKIQTLYFCACIGTPTNLIMIHLYVKVVGW